VRLYDSWIDRGFDVYHTPGVSRAWVRTETDGEQFLLTDAIGFDLPDHDGPFQIFHFASDGELIAGPVRLETRLALAAWLRQRTTIPIPTDPRI